MRRPLRPLLALAPLAPLALLLAGCEWFTRKAFQRPTVEFRGARLRNSGLGGGVVDVQLMLRNPNAYPLTVAGATYRVYAGDSVEVGQGMMRDTLAVPPEDSALVQLPLNFTWRSLLAASRQARVDGTIEYRVSGEVVGVTPVGDYTFPVNTRGRASVPRPQLP